MFAIAILAATFMASYEALPSSVYPIRPNMNRSIDLPYANWLIEKPQGIEEESPSEDDFPSIRHALWVYSINAQLMDVRECVCFFTELKDFNSDLEIMRRRRAELAGVPKLGEVYLHLPSYEYAGEALWFNSLFMVHLEKQSYIHTDRHEFYAIVSCETKYCWKVWDLIRDVQSTSYYNITKRYRLKELIKLVGVADFWSGNFPPPIPTWRFSEIN